MSEHCNVCTCEAIARTRLNSSSNACLGQAKRFFWTLRSSSCTSNRSSWACTARATRGLLNTHTFIRTGEVQFLGDGNVITQEPRKLISRPQPEEGTWLALPF